MFELSTIRERESQVGQHGPVGEIDCVSRDSRLVRDQVGELMFDSRRDVGRRDRDDGSERERDRRDVGRLEILHRGQRSVRSRQGKRDYREMTHLEDGIEEKERYLV